MAKKILIRWAVARMSFLKTIFTVVASLTFASAASAGDMAVKATTYKISDWTGMYAGASLGAKWGSTSWATASVIDSGRRYNLDGSELRGYDSTSSRAGVYLGYNWQFAPRWVGGVEFDWAYSNKEKTTAGVPGCSIQCGGAPGPVNDLSSVKLGWDASVRARLGVLISPTVMAYGTGGVAWQKVESSVTCQFSGPDPFCVGQAGTPFVTTTNSTIRTGWTVGGGVDAKLIENWILRADYRYSAFGAASINSSLISASNVSTVNYDLKINTHIATVGIAYQFGALPTSKQ